MQIYYTSCMHIMINYPFQHTCMLAIHACCFDNSAPRKGPLERVPFPTLSQTQSPFQQLGHHLLLLGKKIDAAQLQKDS